MAHRRISPPHTTEMRDRHVADSARRQAALRITCWVGTFWFSLSVISDLHFCLLECVAYGVMVSGIAPRDLWSDSCGGGVGVDVPRHQMISSQSGSARLISTQLIMCDSRQTHCRCCASTINIFVLQRRSVMCGCVMCGCVMCDVRYMFRYQVRIWVEMACHIRIVSLNTNG